jgi:hypothetical protein
LAAVGKVRCALRAVHVDPAHGTSVHWQLPGEDSERIALTSSPATDVIMDALTPAKAALLDPPRAIGWLPGQEKDEGHLEFGGWIWRYDLAPLGPSETEVTLTYDWSAVPQSIREYLQFPPFGPEHLSNSLHHLALLAAPASRAWTLGG